MIATFTSTVVTTQTPNSSQSNNSKNSTKSKSTVGAAVGGTIGGIALLALLAVWYRRTRRPARSFEQPQATDKGSSFDMQSMPPVNERRLTSSQVGDGGGSSMQGMDT